MISFSSFPHQTQNDYLRDWLPLRPLYLNMLLEREANGCDAKCSVCNSCDGIVRCSDCFGNVVWCETCVIKSHQNLPFHRIQVWDGKCFLKSSLFKIGFILHLGHGGNPCPCHPSEMDDWKDEDMDKGELDGEVETQEDTSMPSNQQAIMVIPHSSGVFHHCVRFCNCPGSSEHHIQLFTNGLFPASIKRPRTAFTFDVLDHFYFDAMECKTAAMGFFQKLRRFTNNAFPNTVPARFHSPLVYVEYSDPCKQNRYRELMRVSRQWRNLESWKRFGFGHDEDSLPGKGDLAIFCPACPQPGINLPENWIDIIKR
jgi:hypothetical protein